jgi:hypothetical protein
LYVFFRVPNSLEGRDGWGEGGEYYMYIKSLGGTVERVQHSSEGRCLSSGCSVALAAQHSSEGCSVALRMQHSSDRVQCSSVECSIA